MTQALAALAVASALALVAAPARAAEKGPHGDAPAQVQREALAALGPLTTPPVNVDPDAWAASIPADNALTPARIELGAKLYFDTRLSADGTVSCATCHDVTRSFTDRRATSEGIAGQIGKRNAPTTLNAALLRTQFWDGRAPTLEAQAKLPILNPIEMGMTTEEEAVAVVRADPEYVERFTAAYGRAPNYEDLARAIASFERTLMFLDAPADRYFAGDTKAIDAPAQRGWVLYNGKARCTACHPLNASNPLGTDNRFHNVGVAARHRDFEVLAARVLQELAKDPSLSHIESLALETDLSELGRFLVSKNHADIGAFRSPMVRNVGITSPYMHDGSMDTLWDVMDHYNKGGEANTYLDGGIEPLDLSEAEIDDIVAFMFTLTDVRFDALNREELARQRTRARTERPFRDEAIARRDRFPFDPRK